MGVRSEFIKATGKCRIKKSLLKELIEKQASSTTTYYYFTWIIDTLQYLTKLEIDGVADEYISLQQVGEIYNDNRLYYYIDNRKVWDLYLLYQMMSLNGMECFKSVTTPPEVEQPSTRTSWYYRRSGYRDYDEIDFNSVKITRYSPPLNRQVMEGIVVEGILNSEIEFKSFDELYKYLGMPINKPILNISISKTERLCDLKIVTKSDELIRKQENKKKKRKYDTEACRLYFLDENNNFFYFEFLPYGQGIKMGTCLYYPYVNSPDNWYPYYSLDDYLDDRFRDDRFTFLQNVRNEHLTWNIKDLY